MNREEEAEEGEEMFEFNENSPQVGTEILDNALPSDINFDEISRNKNRKMEYEGEEISRTAQYTQKNKQQSGGDLLKIYSVRGFAKIEQQPKFHEGSIVKDGSLTTYQVKAMDEQKNSGLKYIWQTIVGYVKRQIYVENGYFYLLELTKEGYFVHKVFKLSQILKIFLDPQENRVRIVFRNEQNHLITKDFQVKKCEDLIQMLSEQIGKSGLMIETSS